MIGMAIGAGVEALIGFFALPIVGAIPGALLGASVGLFIGWAATGPAPAPAPKQLTLDRPRLGESRA